MKCGKCGAQALQRQGRFGAFWCCPNSRPGDNHGTQAVQRPRLMLLESAPAPRRVDLEEHVRTAMVAHFGVHMTELDRFIEGDWRDADPEDEDHWSNQRPY